MLKLHLETSKIVSECVSFSAVRQSFCCLPNSSSFKLHKGPNRNANTRNPEAPLIVSGRPT